MSDANALDEIKKHAAWIDRITPYLDEELDPATRAEMREHIAGCALCERELTRQRVLAGRLRALADRTDMAQRAESIKRRVSGEVRGDARPATHSNIRINGLGWLVAGIQTAILVIVLSVPSYKAEDVPMVDEAYADYQHMNAKDFPLPVAGRSTLATLPLPVEPLNNAGARLIGSWQTQLRGQPAAVLAYRVSDHIVLQYVVSEQLFFTPQRVREAVSKTGFYVSQKNQSTIVAWPGRQSGSLLIGDLPRDQLIRLIKS